MDIATQKRGNKNTHRAVIRAFLQDYKSARPCSCGESRYQCLQFHHKDPKQKEYELFNLMKLCWGKKIERELAKCMMLCSNCHQISHNHADYIDGSLYSFTCS